MNLFNNKISGIYNNRARQREHVNNMQQRRGEGAQALSPATQRVYQPIQPYTPPSTVYDSVRERVSPRTVNIPKVNDSFDKSIMEKPVDYNASYTPPVLDKGPAKNYNNSILTPFGYPGFQMPMQRQQQSINKPVSFAASSSYAAAANAPKKQEQSGYDRQMSYRGFGRNDTYEKSEPTGRYKELQDALDYARASTKSYKASTEQQSGGSDALKNDPYYDEFSRMSNKELLEDGVETCELKVNSSFNSQMLDEYELESSAVEMWNNKIMYGSDLEDNKLMAMVEGPEKAGIWFADVFGREKGKELSKQLDIRMEETTPAVKRQNDYRFKDYTKEDYAIPDAAEYKKQNKVGEYNKDVFGWSAALDIFQAALDVAGMIPGLGAAPDLINAAIYAVRGEWLNAGLSAAAAIPMTAGESSGKAAKALNMLGDATRFTGRLDNAANVAKTVDNIMGPEIKPDLYKSESMSDKKQQNESSCFDYNTRLSYNQTYNENVKLLQKRLSELGYLDMSDGGWGYFGLKTQDAVNRYKHDNGLGNTGADKGVVGKQTWASLGLLYREPEDIDAGVTIKTIGDKQYFDVTEPLNRKLYDAGKLAETKWNPIEKIFWFLSQVYHEKPWDIKRQEPWEKTLGITYPGSYDSPVVLFEEIITPEELGNITYGYIGAALGLTLLALYAGSVVAALPMNEAEWGNEFGDHPAIERGYNWYKENRT